MIRKVTSILLVFLILFSNSGWAFSFHFCNDNLASITLENKFYYVDNQDSCSSKIECCYEDNQHNDCCNDKLFESSSSDSKFLSKIFELNLSFFTLSEQILHIFENVSVSKAKKKNPAFYVDLKAPPLYKLYCQLMLQCMRRVQRL